MARQVARIVVGDGLVQAPRSQPLPPDELGEQLRVMDDLVVATKIRVLVSKRVETVRAGGDDLRRFDPVQQLDVALRLLLEAVLVADAPGRIARAFFLAPQNSERDAGLGQKLRYGSHDFVVALDERAAFAAREGMRASLPTTLALSYPPQLGEREAYEAYLGRYLANDPVCFGFAFRALARTNMLHMLPQIRCPAMVVAGRHYTVRQHASSAELAKKIPGARFELIDDGGHFLPTQAPRALTALLEEFLPR